MELKTLWLGLVISLGAFAVKTGLGWAYLWTKRPPGQRLAVTLAVFGLYAVLFAGLLALVSRLNILAHSDLFQPLWQGGMALHWLVALMLFLWGFILLRSKAVEDWACEARPSWGWLALVIPCPVCLSVVLMSTACLVMYFPDDAPLATAALWAAFTAIAGTAGLSLILGKSIGGSLEHTLGLAMLVMASYFMLSALIMPQFAEISKIYRLAAYGAEKQGDGEPLIGGLTMALAVLLGLTGFILTRHRLKKAPINQGKH
ncbi:MAG: DUF2162 domain-containing protein [Candidatus Adiutrix sp.]|jgi:predicted transporter|nr:DUF2162 domain-containing protein [Candidatus Adiutrix sp.]